MTHEEEEQKMMAMFERVSKTIAGERLDHIVPVCGAIAATSAKESNMPKADFLRVCGSLYDHFEKGLLTGGLS